MPYQDPNIQSANADYTNALDTASQYQTAADMLPEALKSAINEKLDYNKDLIKEKNQSMVDYFNAPSQARLQYQDIFNPFQREALVQSSTNNAYLPYKNNQDILAARLGSIKDIIDLATGSFTKQTTSASNAAEIAKGKLDLAKWAYEQTHQKPGTADNTTPDLTGAINMAEVLAQKDLNGDGLIGGLTTNKNNEKVSYQEPPMSPGYAGIEKEWPMGSGVIWISNAQHGWD